MIETIKHNSPEVLSHLLVLTELRDRMRSIQRKIEEVTARLSNATDALDPQNQRSEGDRLAILSALMELDDMLGQPDLITRDELRSHLQDLVQQLGDPGSPSA